MKLVFMLTVVTSFNHTLSEIPYQKLDTCREVARAVMLPYLASCIPRLVPMDTKVF